MAIPANSRTVWRGTTKTLEANGSSITSNSLVQADDANYDTSSDGEGAPDAEFSASFTFGSAPTEGTVLAVFARPLDVIGTGDTEVPEMARPTRYIGRFVVNNVTSLQYGVPFVSRDLPKQASYYMGNVATGQTVSTGWTLYATPIADAPA